MTNDDFAAFVAATGFQTENERFGWSFVFEALLTEEILRNITQAVAGAGACACAACSVHHRPCRRLPILLLDSPYTAPHPA